MILYKEKINLTLSVKMYRKLSMAKPNSKKKKNEK